MVEYKNDSIFVWRKPFLQEPDTTLFFKGKRIKGKIPNTPSQKTNK